MALDTTSFAYALKTLYPRQRVERIEYTDNPFLALVPKDEGFTGKNKVIGTIYAPTPGRSVAFATAQANKGNHSGVAFTITRVKDYALASIDGETIEASKGDANALVEALDTEIEQGFLAATRSLATALFGDGAGNIGQVSGVAANVITLINVNDVTNFEVGMKLQANPTRTGTVGNMRAGTMTITAVDRDAGTVTCSGGTVAGLAANDYLYVHGDYDGKVKGLDAWNPSSAPTSTPFFGVDRSVDPTRLGGVRFDGSAYNPDEALIKAAQRLAREGGSPSHVVTNYADWANLELALGTKVQYADAEALGEGGVKFGFRAIVLSGPKGPIKVIADQNAPSGVARMLQLNTWKLHSLGMAPKVLSLDGNKMLRDSNADSYEVRIGYYAQLACTAPGFNARIVMPT